MASNESYGWARFLVVFAVGVLGFGLLNSGLHVAGYPTLGTVVWIIGYGLTAFVLWYGWLRNIELVGSSGV